MNQRRDQWVDAAAGPVVRPYAMTRGRTRPTNGTLDLITMIVRNNAAQAGTAGLDPEHLHILDLASRPLSVADVTSAMDLPLGVVRVLVGDLIDRNLLKWRDSAPTPDARNDTIYRELLHGLRSL